MINWRPPFLQTKTNWLRFLKFLLLLTVKFKSINTNNKSENTVYLHKSVIYYFCWPWRETSGVDIVLPVGFKYFFLLFNFDIPFIKPMKISI